MRWRFLYHGPADGAWNMAVDEALLESAAPREPACSNVPPVTVRLYRFSRATVTFGYAQRLDDAVDARESAARGVDVVRRITGGRALLHTDELTYSVTGSADGVFAGYSVRSIYGLVIAPIRSVLSKLGVAMDGEVSGDAAPFDGAASVRSRPALPCLSVPTRHELTVRGRKLLPSAQRWRKRAFLQHGSLLKSVPVPLMQATMRLAPGPVPAIGLEELGFESIAEDEMMGALRDAYAELFSEPPSGSHLLETESLRVRGLSHKYRSQTWTDLGRWEADEVATSREGTEATSSKRHRAARTG